MVLCALPLASAAPVRIIFDTDVGNDIDDALALAMIHAMETQGVRRLVCITGIGAGDSRGHGGFLYDKIIFPWFTKETYAERTDRRP